MSRKNSPPLPPRRPGCGDLHPARLLRGEGFGFYRFGSPRMATAMPAPVAYPNSTVSWEWWRSTPCGYEATQAQRWLNSPWCMYLIFYKAGDIAGCVIWRRIWQPTWRYGGNEVAADDSGSRTANECVRRARKSGFSVPAACPHPVTCAGSGSD